MARFTKSFRSLQSARRALPPGLKALGVIVAVAVLLTVGQVTLQARMVEAQIAQAELQAQAEQARAELQVQEKRARAELQAEMEQARIEARIQAQNVESDRAALTALFNSAGGSGWTNAGQWNTDGALNQWHGVTTNNSGRVTVLRLGDNNLTGTIPADLGNLTDLTELTLYGNSLSGSIPAELGNLSSLVTISLRDNSLSGSIPASLGSLSSLRELALFNNSLTGTVPAELGNLSATTFVSLQLSGNQLTGQLPYSLTRLTSVDNLGFENNAGLCAPPDSDFQTWFQNVGVKAGDTCPRTRIRAGTAAPVVGEPVFVELTAREDRLARISTTLADYTSNPCIGYDTSRNVHSGWQWYWSDAGTSPWHAVGAAGKHPYATFVYIPQAGDVGRHLYASITAGGTEYTSAVIGPIAAAHGVASGDIVSVAAPTGTLAVDNDLSVSLPDAAVDERHDPAINPRLNPWQWERSDDGSTGWENVTPYHLSCAPSVPDSQYSLVTEDDGKHLRSYIYYNDDSSGSAVLKRGETASVGPVAP